VIASFRDRDTRALAAGQRIRRFHGIEKIARRKLRMIQAATQLIDLASPPGNRLETLAGDRKGQYSIRVNDQWRICFIWRSDGAHEVEIVDYH
jgi:toxin HigB-1